jgi:hypothetical protein
MKAIYYLRVIFVSIEALVILLGLSFFYYCGSEIVSFIVNFKPNDKALEWVVAYPLGLMAWMLKDGVSVLFPDSEKLKILHGWPGYWRLRAHFNVGLAYGLFAALVCVIVWLKGGIGSAKELYIFLVSACVLSVSASSFYLANIKLKEILIHATE